MVDFDEINRRGKKPAIEDAEPFTVDQLREMWRARVEATTPKPRGKGETVRHFDRLLVTCFHLLEGKDLQP